MRVSWYTMSRQSGRRMRRVCAGTLVQYQQTIRSGGGCSECAREHWDTMSEQLGNQTARAARGTPQLCLLNGRSAFLKVLSSFQILFDNRVKASMGTRVLRPCLEALAEVVLGRLQPQAVAQEVPQPGACTRPLLSSRT